MPVSFKSTFNGAFPTSADLDDVYVRKEYFVSGLLYDVGVNNFGQLGDNTTTNKSSPVQTVAGGTDWKSVMVGSQANWSGAIKTDGSLWLWGANASGQLGDNSITVKSSPVQTVAGGTVWKQVSGGTAHTGAVKTDGTLWMWGSNSFGELGDSTVAAKSSPVQTVAGGASWKQVSLGTSFSVAIKTDGTLWSWGLNSYGQLGDNTATNKSSPVQTVAGGTNWKQASLGNGTAAAIKTDGTLWLWGLNNFGELGDNSVTLRSSPVQTVAGGTNWKQVSLGYRYSTAIKTDGTLWTWGQNNRGQLGDNTISIKSSPAQTIAGGTNWKQIVVGNSHAAAIKTNGTLWTWGRNFNGQLGDNTAVDKSSPVQTVAGGTSWKQVSGMSATTNAIT